MQQIVPHHTKRQLPVEISNVPNPLIETRTLYAIFFDDAHEFMSQHPRPLKQVPCQNKYLHAINCMSVVPWECQLHIMRHRGKLRRTHVQNNTVDGV